MPKRAIFASQSRYSHSIRKVCSTLSGTLLAQKALEIKSHACEDPEVEEVRLLSEGLLALLGDLIGLDF